MNLARLGVSLIWLIVPNNWSRLTPFIVFFTVIANSPSQNSSFWSLRSAECWGDLFNPCASFRRQALERRQEVRMSHTRTEIGPAIRLRLHFRKILAFACSQPAARRALEGIKIKLHLLL